MSDPERPLYLRIGDAYLNLGQGVDYPYSAFEAGYKAGLRDRKLTVEETALYVEAKHSNSERVSGLAAIIRRLIDPGS